MNGRQILRLRRAAGIILLALCSAARPLFAAPPAVFWHSDPVGPGETVLVIGDSLAGCRKVQIERMPESGSARPIRAEVSPLQVQPHSLKFVLPNTLPPGLFRAAFSTPEGAAQLWINRPQILWMQGDSGRDGTPGGFVRVMGNCLAAGAGRTRLRLRGAGRSVTLMPSRAEPFTAQAALPPSLPPGSYQVELSSGAGGAEGWSGPAAFRIGSPAPVSQARIMVPPAESDAEENTETIQTALDRLKPRGGTVLLASGRYLVSGGLTIPPGVTLRGAGMGLTALCWADMDAPPDALIRGQDHFAVEDLSLYAVNYKNGIVADQATLAAGHVRILRVRLRLDPYRGHLTTDEVNRRLVEALKLSTGGGDSLRLGGHDVEVTGCDIYGAGRCLYLSRGVGVWIHDNAFYNGRWGWYSISGSNGVIFERNTITGADLMSTGGGLNCLDGSTVSQNVYYAQNHLSHMFGWDREAMTTDAGGGAYYGRVQSTEGAHLTLAADPQWNQRDWAGAAVFILGGRGQGQYRQIVKTDGRGVTLDRPWQVPPEAASVITITMLQRHYLFIGNTFEDAGVALQMYGTSVENIASGNVSARTGGFHNFGMNYDGIQPSWFVQWLNNRITEGNVFGGGHDQTEAVGEAHLAVQALPPNVTLEAPLTLGAIVRGNRLDNNAHLEVGLEGSGSGITYPYVQDVVVENNYVANAALGLRLSRATAGVLVRNNVFQRCAAGLVDERETDKQTEAALRKLAAAPGPLLRLTFSAAGRRYPDAAGHGFEARCQGQCDWKPDGVHGGCVVLNGQGYLEVAHSERLPLDNFTLSVWVKSDHLSGRWGILAKRFASAPAPFVLTEQDGRVGFEATDTQGRWSFNFQSPPLLTPGVWHHLAAVHSEGKGVVLYVDGQEAAHLESTERMMRNDAPVCLGRDAWGGDPPDSNHPSFFTGSLSDVQIWPHALSAAEISRLAVR